MTDTHVSPDAVIADALIPDGAPDYAPGTGHYPEPDESVWQIDGRRTAEWALAKVRAAHQGYADATAPAREAIDILQARIDELSEFIAREGEQRDHTVGFFTGHLTAWLRRLRRKDLDDGIAPDKATKSMKLAGGTVASRAGQDRVDVTDAIELCEWADSTEGEDFAMWVPKVDQRKLRAYITESGEVPPGVTVIPASEDDRSYRVDIK